MSSPPPGDHRSLPRPTIWAPSECYGSDYAKPALGLFRPAYTMDSPIRDLIVYGTRGMSLTGTRVRLSRPEAPSPASTYV